MAFSTMSPTMSPTSANYNTHFPSHEREYGMPKQPRIFIPPPTTDVDHSNPQLHVQTALRTLLPADQRKIDFLKRVTAGAFEPYYTETLWAYEDRRKAQHVLPFMVLGPSAAARDEAYLRAEGITMVIAVRDMKSALARLMEPRVADRIGLETLRLDVNGNPQLIASFPRAVDAINDHLGARYAQHSRDPQRTVLGKVLIYCETGNERSAAVVAAYLMSMYPINHVQALQVMQAQRFCIAMNDDMREILRTYNEIIAAQRDLAIDFTHLSLESRSREEAKKPARQGATKGTMAEQKLPSHRLDGDSTTTNRAKRTFDADDELMAGSGEFDAARFANREVVAPFAESQEDSWVSLNTRSHSDDDDDDEDDDTGDDDDDYEDD